MVPRVLSHLLSFQVGPEAAVGGTQALLSMTLVLGPSRA